MEFRAAQTAVCFSVCAGVLLIAHRPFLHLPYFWDEIGQFIPEALDLFREGRWIPHSAIPNIHPPLIPAVLAAAWKLAGCNPTVTRVTMLLVAASGLASTLLLTLQLSGDLQTAFLAAGLLFASPLFFAQSLLAQLDAPTMALTALALLLFLREHLRLSAAVCVLLVLVKETGLVAPVLLGLHLAFERRWKSALWFAGSGLALAVWLWALRQHTGCWAGNRAFLQYNLYDPLHPMRLLLAVLRRLYFLGFADLRWLGWIAIGYGWKKRGLFRTRAWSLAFWIAAAHAASVTALGGAVLERYLLPVFPILYAAMAMGVMAMPRAAALAVTTLLFTGLAVNHFLNPPYPFAYENNLAFADFLDLQTAAARYLETRHVQDGVYTLWPLSAALSQPALGYVSQPISAHALPHLTEFELQRLDWRRVRALVAYSRDWNPKLNLINQGPFQWLYQRGYGYPSPLPPAQLRTLVPLPLRQHWTRHGQWLDVYMR
jgi:4-amino-4-deoxy-L-arabinose transferase-like glycosyltransferase